MSDYKVPMRDIRFVMNDLFDFQSHYQKIKSGDEADADLIEAILQECAKFAENELAPLNRIGDEQGCTFNEGEVSTPDGFKEAYALYVEGGWPALSHVESHGGQGLPESLSTVTDEMLSGANWAWNMYPGLSHGAVNTLVVHGTEQQKNHYLAPLISGQWTGTMCLTESQCGTDLGLLRTRAEAAADGSYAITGTKIFISAGEHDLAENIVHIVLARLPDAPAGTKGISLFIVPKLNVDENGQCTDRNSLSCGSIEHKMGIHGNATCVMNFDGARGYLLGDVNKGLSYMFTFMNSARLWVAMQGLAHSEHAFQGALAYAKERLQMRSMSGVKNPQGVADPIIVHPDVRRMLLTQKVFAEGGRMLLYHTAMLVDRSSRGIDEEDRKLASDELALLTPIAKAFLTETGFESANIGIQVLGGHGYIRESGMEQILRDSRIATLYEGTTGIQALDLLGRKVLGSKGRLLKPFIDEVLAFCKHNENREGLDSTMKVLSARASEWAELTEFIASKAEQDLDEIGAASVDYTMYSGYVVLAYFWARAAVVAKEKVLQGEDVDFYRAKLQSTQFYYEKILPRTLSHASQIRSGCKSLMEIDVDAFAF